VVAVPWVLDIDATVKPLYGHQQGAQIGYNPHKPGHRRDVKGPPAPIARCARRQIATASSGCVALMVAITCVCASAEVVISSGYAKPNKDKAKAAEDNSPSEFEIIWR
jgi:hypothetical protein